MFDYDYDYNRVKKKKRKESKELYKGSEETDCERREE